MAPGWLTIAVGFAVIAVSTVLVRSAGLHGRLGALPVLVVAAACCVRSMPGAALFVGGLGWAFTTGFLVNRLGELTFGHQDLLMLLLSVTAALTVCIGSALRRVDTVQTHHPSPVEESQRG